MRKSFGGYHTYPSMSHIDMPVVYKGGAMFAVILSDTPKRHRKSIYSGRIVWLCGELLTGIIS